MDYNFYRSFERTAPIHFNKLLTSEKEDVAAFLDGKRNLFSLANTHSLIDVIRMGESLADDNLADHITFFKQGLGGLMNRLPKNYSVYRLFSHKVSCFSKFVHSFQRRFYMVSGQSIILHDLNA